ncbi:MAG: prepilin-type N-terminal cleavage/methylation domain-containing protein, partial [Clostridia bacterium]
MKKEKGVTLVALVITMIILIILAGISINTLVGDDGIITKAKQAKQNILLA